MPALKNHYSSLSSNFLCLMNHIISSCKKRNPNKLNLGRDLETIAYLKNSLSPRTKRTPSPCMIKEFHFMRKTEKDLGEVKVGQKVIGSRRYVGGIKNKNRVKKREIRVTGQSRKTRSIIGFCKFIMITSSTSKWGDWIKFSKRCLCSLALEKLNSAGVIIKKWRKSTIPSPRSFSTWGMPITPQKTPIPSMKICTIIRSMKQPDS